MSLAISNLETPKARAKQELLFNKPASGLVEHLRQTFLKNTSISLTFQNNKKKQKIKYCINDIIFVYTRK
jgi:hypothetical protein